MPRGNELVIITTTNNSISATRLPQLGSNLSKPITHELKVESSESVICRKNIIIYGEMKESASYF